MPPLLDALDDAGASRRRVPSRRGRAAEALARLSRHPAVGEERHHVATAQRRVDEVEEREDPPPERALRERRAVVEVDGDPASANTASTSGR